LHARNIIQWITLVNKEYCLEVLTPKSDAVGRYTMNPAKALNFDIKMIFGNELREKWGRVFDLLFSIKNGFP